jgi:hypothetical protein
VRSRHLRIADEELAAIAAVTEQIRLASAVTVLSSDECATSWRKPGSRTSSA